jgi:hypothetical protein
MRLITKLNKWKAGLLASCLLLGACDTQERDYSYLMTHPKVLEKLAADCQSVISSKCNAVNHAANDFSILLNQRRENPEEFGRSIMQVEYQVNELRKKILTGPPSSDKNKLQTAYLDKQQELQVFLAVVSASSNVG